MLRRLGSLAFRRSWRLPRLPLAVMGAALAVAIASPDGARHAAAEQRASPKPAAKADHRAGTARIIGQILTYRIQKGETMLDVARHFELGYVELMAANRGVDPWLPKDGTLVTIPTAHILPAAPREGIVINAPEMRLYFFPPDGGEPQTYPIGVGRDGLETPPGSTTVVRKAENPTWRPTPRMRKEDPTLPAVVPPGPDNPLGEYAIYLGWPTYAVHGTHKPWGVGRRVSSGCIRMYPEGVKRLFPQVAKGTKVTVVYQEVKIAWLGSELFLEIHPSIKQADQLEETGSFEIEDLPDLKRQIRALADVDRDRVDWEAVDQEIRERTGVPIQITRSDFLTAERRQPPRPDIAATSSGSVSFGQRLSLIEAEMETAARQAKRAAETPAEPAPAATPTASDEEPEEEMPVQPPTALLAPGNEGAPAPGDTPVEPLVRWPGRIVRGDPPPPPAPAGPTEAVAVPVPVPVPESPPAPTLAAPSLAAPSLAAPSLAAPQAAPSEPTQGILGLLRVQRGRNDLPATEMAPRGGPVAADPLPPSRVPSAAPQQLQPGPASSAAPEPPPSSGAARILSRMKAATGTQ